MRYPVGPNARSGPMSYFCDWAVFTQSAGDSFKCSIRLSATHRPLCSDPHPSLTDGVHGPFHILYLIGPNVGGLIAPWSLIREILVQIQCRFKAFKIYSFKAYFTGN